MKKYLKDYRQSKRSWNIIGCKGCYSKCQYCTRSDKKLRFRDVRDVVAEMRFLYSNYGINRFNFVDDNFLCNHRYSMQMAKEIDLLDFDITFRFQGRVDRINEDLLVELKQRGLSGISFGIESGSQTILDEMKKDTTVSMADRCLELCRKYNMPYHANFIIGMPSESHETIQQTYDFLERHNFINNYRVGFLTLFPGTPLYNTALREGTIDDEDSYCESLNRVYEELYTNQTKFSDEQLFKWKNKLDHFKTENINDINLKFNGIKCREGCF